MNRPLEFRVDLRQMVLAIETAIDLVGITDTNHGKRVGYIALQLADSLEFSEDEKHFIFELGLLHDCGVSSDTIHHNLVNQFDWHEADAHCEIGYQLLKDFLPLAQLAVPVLYHHTRWEELKNYPISSREKILANLIFLADRVDVSAANHYGRDILIFKKDIQKFINKNSGTYFDPKLVDRFIEISSTEAFWISLEDRHITRFAWDLSHCGCEKKLSMDDLIQLAKIFAFIVDQKSPFTARHSAGVALLAGHLARKCNLPEDEIGKVELAGYLHDVGKLRIPDSILAKPGALTALERSIINQHSYETYEILRPIKGFEEIAKWAAYHHENSLGTGYPFHPKEIELNTQVRIIAVADVFQALVQNRPYRKGLGMNQVLKILQAKAEKGKLDKAIVEMAVEDARQCYEMATGGLGEDHSSINFFESEHTGWI